MPSTPSRIRATLNGPWYRSDRISTLTHILVTGGAGYIGSHTARLLCESGFRVTVLDNLYSGHAWAVPAEARFVEGDAGNRATVDALLRDSDIAAVVHFAGHIVVPESVEDPLKYYNNNVGVSQTLVSSCIEHGIERFIFSSSAAVYGMPETIPAHEGLPTAPINPYGATKLITEWLLRDVAASSDRFRYCALRYFNVAGAHASGELGQATPEATHLIKIASETVCGQRDRVTVFGTDYATPDGTCIRDYIHIEDLAEAHLLAVRHLLDGGASEVFNCGYGRGFSVREVLDTVRRVSGVEFTVEEGARRAGDPPELVADSSRIRSALGFSPSRDDLELICRSAVDWERSGRATR